jgi:DNA polymerase-3 subunit delta
LGTLTPAAVRKQIASGDVDPVYLLQGEDDVERSALAAEFADLVEEGLRAFNVETIHASEMTSGDRIADGVASIVAAARTLPMMVPRRVVVVAQAESLLAPKRDSEAATRALEQLAALIERPEPLTTVVFVAAVLDRRTRTFKSLAKHATLVDCGSPADIAGAERWIRARLAQAGVEIDPAGARALATLAGFPERPRNDGRAGDVKRLRGEVERLLLYAFGQKKIDLDDVREVAGPAALQDDWAMANAIEAGQGGEALRQLSLTLDAGAPPEKVLGQLGWLVRSKFPQVAPNELRGAIESLFRTDVDLKRSGGDPRVLLERLIVELCGGKRTRTGSGPRRW